MRILFARVLAARACPTRPLVAVTDFMRLLVLADIAFDSFKKVKADE